LVSDADKAPEFHAQTLPAGSAPADKTFKPNANDDAPPLTAHQSDNDPESERTKASDTIVGATSADVHTGYGHPGQGQSSRELRHDGGRGQAGGLEAVGGSGAQAHGLVDKRLPEHADQRVIGSDKAQTGQGNVGGPSAEDRI